MRLALLTIAVALLVPGRASADWQYTRWGMTPAEVVAASGGRATGVESEPDERVFELDYRAVAPYRAMNVEVEARFFFTQGSGRLAAVKLIPTDVGRCDALRGAVEAVHGRSSHQDFGFGSTWRWRDEANNDQLLFAEFKPVGTVPRACHLIYRPLGSGAAQ
jgi:hypothetical protein